MHKFTWLLLMLMSVSGCATGSQTQRYVKQGLESQNQLAKSVIGAARAQPGANQSILDAYETELEASIAAQRGEMQKIRQEVERMERAWKDLLTGVAKLAGDAFPGGSLLQNFVAAFTKVKNETQGQATKLVGELQSDMKDRFAEVDEKINAMGTSISALNESNKLRDQKEQFDEESLEDKLKVRLAKLDNFDIEKFEGEVKKAAEQYANMDAIEVKAEVLSELEKAGFSAKDLRELREMPADEFAGLLGAGGGGLLGILALIRTMGPSRGKAEQAVVAAQFQSIKEEMQRMRGVQSTPPVVVTAPVAQPGGSGSGTSMSG